MSAVVRASTVGPGTSCAGRAGCGSANVAGGALIRHRDAWERPVLWLTLIAVGLAVVLYAWASIQMMTVDLTRQEVRLPFEMVDASDVDPIGWPPRHDE